MDTRLGHVGHERTASLTGRTRTAVTVAAMVILSAFATDTATPASARETDSTMVANDVPSSEIVTTVPAPKTTVLTRIKSGMASWYGSGMQGHRTTRRPRFRWYELTAAPPTRPVGRLAE